MAAHHPHTGAAPDEQVGQVAQAVVADRAHALEAKVRVVLHQALVPGVCAAPPYEPDALPAARQVPSSGHGRTSVSLA